MEEADRIEKLRIESKKNLELVVRTKIGEAQIALKKWPEFQKRVYEHTGPFNGEDLVNLVEISTRLKYRPAQYVLPGPFINAATLLEKLEALENDSRVLYAATDHMWILFDMYVDCVILDNILNSLFSKKVDRKLSNKYHGYYRQALGLDKKRMDPGLLNLMPQLNLIAHPVEEVLQALEEMSDSDFTKDKIVLLMEYYIAGNHIKFRKQLFPMLYSFVVLNKEMEDTGKFGEPNDIKKILLFEPLSLIIPDKQFWTKDEFTERFKKSKKPLYGGNYYHYQRDTVRTVIGK